MNSMEDLAVGYGILFVVCFLLHRFYQWMHRPKKSWTERMKRRQGNRCG